MNRYKKEDLEELILNKNFSYEEIGRMYGVSGVAIKKAALRLDIPLLQRRNINPNETFNKGIIRNPKAYCLNCGKEFIIYSTKTNKYCSNTCQIEYQHKQKYQKILDGDASIMRANYTPFNFKPDILKEQNNKCCICGCEPIHNGKPLVFVLDHIDGNAANNKRDNLRMICPNCDTQLDTFKSKNKNGARHYYRYHKQKD